MTIVSVDWCRIACNGYVYFGLQKGDSDGEYVCRCDNSYGTSSGSMHTNQNQCEEKCPGNTNQHCGGLRTNAVYRTVVPATVIDNTVGISFEYPISLGNTGVPETRCVFVDLIFAC